MLEWGTLWTFVAMSWVLFISFGVMYVIVDAARKQLKENKKEDGPPPPSA